MAEDGSYIAGSTLHHRIVSAPIRGETGLIPNGSLLLSGKRKVAAGFLSVSVAGALLDTGSRLDASQYLLMYKIVRVRPHAQAR